MADDGGLELNIVSSPAASTQDSSRRNKRGSGKAWDKKRKKKNHLQPSFNNSTNNKHSASHDDTTNKGHVRNAQGSSQPTAPAEATTAPATTRDGLSSLAPHSAAATNKKSPPRRHDGGRERGSVREDVAPQPPRYSASTATTTTNSTALLSAASPSNHANKGASTRSPKSHTATALGSPASSTPKEPSLERQRVLAMAGHRAAPRAATTTKASDQEHQQKSGGGKQAAESGPSSARAAKRKRPGGSRGGVSSGGVVDFTVGDDDNRKVDPKKLNPDKSRRAAATAAAVAKATAAMAKAGGRWWDDDDDDHVVSAAKKAKTVVPASGGDYHDWNYAADDGGEEPVEPDKDGGLPSDIRPNSVRTKAVDMNGEASNAMGILSVLLEEGGSVGRAESRRVKNGGKSKKKAKEVTEGPDASSVNADEAAALQRANPGSVDATTTAAAAAVAPTAMETDTLDSDGEGGTVAAGDSCLNEDVLHKEWGNAAGASGGGGDGGVAGSGSVGIGSRKNRGRDSAPAEGGVPLPEHHARPRELSRRAAAKPLASARSAHVMAAGPGATFAALGMPPKMVAHLEEPRGDRGGGGMGLAGPTVCQLAAVPVLAAGHNAVIKSETGSGKTLAYLLPLLCDLAAMQPRVEREKGTLAVVLAPTRELAAQILEVLTKVVRPFIWLVPGIISGGERRKSEKARLRKGVTVLVCTPGRLLDHLKATQCFRREWLRWLVLDEADRLMDLGFEKQVKEIVELLDQSARAIRSGPAGGSRVKGGEVAPSVKVIKRQTVMVSATLEKGVSRLAAVLLSKHVRVDADANVVEAVDESGKVKLISGDRGAVKHKGGAAQQRLPEGGRNDVHSADNHGGSAGAGAGPTEEFSTPRQLVQYYMTVTQKLRLPALCAFLRARAREKVVVFMSTCDAVDFHHDLFRRARWPGDAPPPPSGGGNGDAGGGAPIPGFEAAAGKDGAGKSKAKKDGAVVVADSEFFGGGCLVRRLHGNVPQTERQSTYKAFGAARSGVLICTDVAARGLDLPTVDWIVQYDPPAETADYVHRVGRTARKGERGHSLLFLLPREAAYLGVLETRGLRPKPLSLEGVLCAADAGKRDARRADEQLAYELQQGLQLLVAGDRPLLDRARGAFQSHVRAYASRAPDSRSVFQVRSLHLGHVARSFALKDPPTAVKVGKRVVRRPGDNKGIHRQARDGAGGGGDNGGDGGGGARGEKRRRDGAGGAGGGVHRLGLSKQTERASRAEFL